MANVVNVFDFTQTLSAFEGSPVSDGTWSDVVVALKIDEPGNGAVATQIDTAAGQLWSNMVDDYIRATYPTFYLGTKVWRVADAAGRDALGSTDGLATDDVAYTEDENRLYAATGVLGPSSSTWRAIRTEAPLTLDQFISNAFGVATVNDFSPGGAWPATHVLRLTPNGGGTTLTGLLAGEAGQLVRICNISAIDNLTLTHEDAGSSAANRFLNANNASLAIRPNDCAAVWYDPTSSRWRSS